jgi:glutaredoxin
MNYLHYAIAALTSCLWLGSVSAQTTIYRIESATGSVTFSDRLPTLAEQGKVVSTGTGAQSISSRANLPFELKGVATKFPVTLYSAKECSPCDAARDHLSARGVPFAERTVNSNEDSAQLQRLSGASTLPFVTIGSQRIKGFSPSDLNQYLDAAGYPASSMLPSGYKNPPATPLVAPPPVEAAKPTAKETPQVVTPTVAPNNPAGIVF